MWLLFSIGIVAALATLLWARRKAPASERRVFITILVAMQAVYFGFVFVAPSVRGFAVEAALVLVFWALARGAGKVAFLLSLGYVLHGFWDLRHDALMTAYVPLGYPEICVAFDWFLAAYFLTRLGVWSHR
ncbi:MAG: hypothetical protein KJN97_10380 [Deltaproteobacteria bacterium]|nr:hypothetical protein [Deltaproteobacteria bacterium]